MLSLVFGTQTQRVESHNVKVSHYTKLLLKEEHRINRKTNSGHISVYVTFFQWPLAIALDSLVGKPPLSPGNFLIFGLYYHSLEKTTKATFSSLFLFRCLLDAFHSILLRNKRYTQIYGILISENMYYDPGGEVPQGNKFIILN